jgi:hypothetical protein
MKECWYPQPLFNNGWSYTGPLKDIMLNFETTYIFDQLSLVNWTYVHVVEYTNVLGREKADHNEMFLEADLSNLIIMTWGSEIYKMKYRAICKKL